MSWPCRPSREGSPLMNKVRHRAYPVREWGGFVWAWLGEPDAMPAFEPPAFAPAQDTQVSIAQDQDSVQTGRRSRKARSTARIRPACIRPTWFRRGWKGRRPTTSPGIVRRPTSRRACRRRPRATASTTSRSAGRSATRQRTTICGSPNSSRLTISLIPPNSSYNVASVIVPISDDETAFHFVAWGGSACPSTEEWRRFNYARPSIDLDEKWRPVRTLDNNFMQDRQAMKLGNFTGIKGIPNQDIAMWVGMGPIVDRTQRRAGRFRPGDRRIPPADGGCGAAGGRRRAGHRHRGAARAACAHRLARGGLSQGDRLARHRGCIGGARESCRMSRFGLNA